MQLYEIPEHLRALMEQLETAIRNGEDPEPYISAIREQAGSAQEKIMFFARQIRNHEAMEAACKAEIERITKRMKTQQNAAERLKALVGEALAALQQQSVTDGPMKASLRKLPSKLVIEDESKIPEEFWRVRPAEREIDIAKTKEALKAGQINIEGVSLVPGGHSVVITS